MTGPVFRKTEAGRAEIGQRSAGLAPAARQLLILINGTDSVQALLAKGLADVRQHLDTLLTLRLIEPVSSSRAPSSASAATGTVAAATPSVSEPPPPAPPASVTAVPAPMTPAEAQAVLALQRRAYQTLVPHFGPDTPLVAEAMLAARTLADYQAALGSIEAKLAIYMGRKQAARTIETLRDGT